MFKKIVIYICITLVLCAACFFSGLYIRTKRKDNRIKQLEQSIVISNRISRERVIENSKRIESIRGQQSRAIEGTRDAKTTAQRIREITEELIDQD
jgi:hypothetical protein